MVAGKSSLHCFRACSTIKPYFYPVLLPCLLNSQERGMAPSKSKSSTRRSTSTIRIISTGIFSVSGNPTPSAAATAELTFRRQRCISRGLLWESSPATDDGTLVASRATTQESSATPCGTRARCRAARGVAVWGSSRLRAVRVVLRQTLLLCLIVLLQAREEAGMWVYGVRQSAAPVVLAPSCVRVPLGRRPFRLPQKIRVEGDSRCISSSLWWAPATLTWSLSPAAWVHKVGAGRHAALRGKHTVLCSTHALHLFAQEVPMLMVVLQLFTVKLVKT